jgi:hypothetical protein
VLVGVFPPAAFDVTNGLFVGLALVVAAAPALGVNGDWMTAGDAAFPP